MDAERCSRRTSCAITEEGPETLLIFAFLQQNVLIQKPRRNRARDWRHPVAPVVGAELLKRERRPKRPRRFHRCPVTGPPARMSNVTVKPIANAPILTTFPRSSTAAPYTAVINRNVMMNSASSTTPTVTGSPARRPGGNGIPSLAASTTESGNICRQTPAPQIAPTNWLTMYNTASGGAIRPVDKNPSVTAGL